MRHPAYEGLKELYAKYSPCVAQVVVRTSFGEPGSGTAFHIGDGWLVTARHVIDQHEIVELVPHRYAARPLECTEVILPRDEAVDLALLRTNFSLDHYMTLTTIRFSDRAVPDEWKADHIPIGGHLDDWLGDELVMTQVLVLGYPRVPQSRGMELVASAGEVNAIIDKYVPPRHPYFILSAMGRGGFSGAPVISEHGWLLGVFTESLVNEGELPQMGFSAALSVEPLWGLLIDNQVFPASNSEFAAEMGWLHETTE